MPVDEGGLTEQVLRKGRAEYTLITGNYTDRSWYSFRQSLLRLGLLSPVLSEADNLSNIRKWANVRANLPRTGIGLDAAFKYYSEVEEKIELLKGRTLTGKEITEFITQQGIALRTSTRSNWFKTVGGYRHNRNYRPDELRTILYQATVYLARKKKDK